MRILFVHTDFRVYWPARLIRLNDVCRDMGWRLDVVEVAGKGSPYAFWKSKEKHEGDWWRCLYPDRAMETVSPRDACRRLYSEMKRTNPDIVFAGSIAFPSGATAVRWARKHHRPIVIFDDARLRDVPRSSFVNWIKRRIYANTDAMLIPSPSHVSDYQFWGVSKERIFFGLNAVDNSFFTERSSLVRPQTESIKKKYGLPGHYFLGVGRQVAKKNWEHLIHAFSSCRKGIPGEWGLVLVGEGPESKRLQEIASRSDAKIAFFPFQDQMTLCDFYGTADCLVLPSGYGETWGLVVNEAMASALPVIVNKDGGCAQTLVNNGLNGWKFDLHAPGALTRILEKFMSLPGAQRRLMGQRSLGLISDWGLPRFCDGVLQAVKFCGQLSGRGYIFPVMDRLIISLWKGRYRPA